jgi:hypothetical protein
MPTIRRARMPMQARRARSAFLGTLATASLILPSFLGIAGATTAPAGIPQQGTLGTQGTRQAASTIAMVAVQPVTGRLADGSVQTTYRLPEGEVITSTTPPAGFNPLRASNTQLTRYGFPLRPSGPAALSGWLTAMRAYRSDSPPAGALYVASRASTAAQKRLMLSTTTSYVNWAGYVVGDESGQSNTYVAVTANFTVPSNSNTCTGSNIAAMWIGLGGTHSTTDLVQQGIVCGDSDVGSGSAYRPFTEFANSAAPVALCGQTSWTVAAGHVIYEQMSFEASSKIANFYFEDETSGTIHSCSSSPPAGWSYDDNTAEWISEAPTGTAVHFSAVNFTSSEAELDSTGSWVTISSQGTIHKDISGVNSSTYCIAPGGIGSDGESFTDSWHAAACS